MSRRVSVITPTFNRAHVLQGAVDSVLGQVGVDVEVIVVDDGSTDATRELMARAYGTDPRVSYLRQDNGGAAAARNTGLALATGEYVAFLDSDDAWKPWHLELQLAGLERFPEAGLIWSNLDAVDIDGRIAIPLALTRLLSAYRYFDFDELFETSLPLADLGLGIAARDIRGRLYSGDVFSPMVMGNLIFTSTVVLRRERLEAVGQFDTSLVTGEDYEFFLRCCRAGPVAFADAASMRYRYGTADRLSGPRMALPMARGYVSVLEATLARDASRITLSPALISEARAFGHRWAAEASIRAGEHSAAWTQLRAAYGQPGHRRRLAALAALNLLPSPVVRRLFALREYRTGAPGPDPLPATASPPPPEPATTDAMPAAVSDAAGAPAGAPAGERAGRVVPLLEPETSSAGDLANGFSSRVLVYFITQVVTAGLGLFNGFLLARLIGPDGRGEFYLLTFYPTTLMVLGQLGLPQAFTFFTARRQFNGLVSRAIAFAIVIGSVLFVATVVLLPELEGTFLRGLEPLAILAGVIALPFMLNANFTTGIVVGRQSAFGMALIYVGVNALTTVLILVLVGALGLGVWGALIGFVASAVVLASAFLFLSLRVTRDVASEGAVDTGRLLRYGLPFFPASLSSFFAARTDVFLLAALLAEPAAPIGFYSLAVGIAELVFLFPNAVSTFFFPHVAGGRRDDSDRQVAAVSRVTLLLTGGIAIGVAPAATLAVLLIIPTFTPALPALYILLAGATLFGPTRVLAGYLGGLGRPGLTSTVSLTALFANVAMNLVAIPRFGIVGAALATLASSLLSSAMCSAIAARLSGEPLHAFWLPRGSDVRYVLDTARTFAVSLRRRRSSPE